MGDCLSKNTHLKELYMYCKYLNIDDVCVLSKISFWFVNFFRKKATEPDEQSILALAGGLKKNATLKKLNVSNNLISASAFRTLVDAINAR